MAKKQSISFCVLYANIGEPAGQLKSKLPYSQKFRVKGLGLTKWKSKSKMKLSLGMYIYIYVYIYKD